MGNEVNLGFFARLGLAFKVLGDAGLAKKLVDLMNGPAAKPAAAPEPVRTIPPEKQHASGLYVLSVMQEEGRLIDFLQQDVAGFSDEEVGGAARVVHGGCRKALERLISVAPVLKDAEGSTINVPAGFNPSQIRLTGNVTGQPPFKGALKHHGWKAAEVKFPSLNDSVDYRIVAPAEVEI